MIYADQAELMPSLEGLAGLGCGNKNDCNCGCSHNKGMGTLVGDDFSWCSSWPWNLLPYCYPTLNEIIKDDSNAGGSLSQESKDRATKMAQDIIDADRKTNPCSYSELDPNSPLSPMEKIFRCGQVNWWIVGGVILGGAIILKRV